MPALAETLSATRLGQQTAHKGSKIDGLASPESAAREGARRGEKEDGGGGGAEEGAPTGTRLKSRIGRQDQNRGTRRNGLDGRRLKETKTDVKINTWQNRIQKNSLTHASVPWPLRPSLKYSQKAPGISLVAKRWCRRPL